MAGILSLLFPRIHHPAAHRRVQSQPRSRRDGMFPCPRPGVAIRANPPPTSKPTLGPAAPVTLPAPRIRLPVYPAASVPTTGRSSPATLSSRGLLFTVCHLGPSELIGTIRSVPLSCSLSPESSSWHWVRVSGLTLPVPTFHVPLAWTRSPSPPPTWRAGRACRQGGGSSLTHSCPRAPRGLVLSVFTSTWHVASQSLHCTELRFKCKQRVGSHEET